MMKEGVIITKINIKRQGERKHFQIKLANDTKYIIGIEYGGRLVSIADKKAVEALPAAAAKSDVLITEAAYVKAEYVEVKESGKTFFKRNQLIGELKLQSSEESNWFYAADVFMNDSNIGLGDFTQSGFPVNDFTHSNKRTEEIVKVDAESTIIQGWYLDAIGKTQKRDINYEITIYVWINVEE